MMKLKANFVILSAVSILLLVTLNLLWTIRLLYSTTSKHPSLNNSVIPVKNLQIQNYIDCPLTLTESTYEKIGNVDGTELAFNDLRLDLGRWDNHNIYKIFDFALVGESFIQSSADSIVCLATQSSVERIHSLVQVAQQWDGPISIAAFIAGNDEFSILQYFVTYMRLCFDFIRKNVTFHIAFPSAQKPNFKSNKILKNYMEKFDCTYPENTLRHFLKIRTAKSIRWRLKNEYPQNHMRNLARKGCQSKYVFLTDVDIIPSTNIVPELNQFLSNVNCDQRCAYVIPTFEIDVRVKFPTTKNELLRLHKKGLARPFHEKVFIYNQFATNFSSWLAVNESGSRIHISHAVTNYEFLYEPFYVSLDNAPSHDERFIGYGFTRNTQVYEMYIAGYAFFVLTPAFTCHWGLQLKKDRPAWREQQNNRNRKRFETFKAEILAKYKSDKIAKKNGRLGR